MSILSLFVWPKIRRVLSGEKIVMTNVIANRFDGNTQRASSGYSHETALNSKAYSVQSKINLSPDDPVPRSVETSVLSFHDFLGDILSLW